MTKEIWQRVSLWPACGQLALLTLPTHEPSDQRIRNVLHQTRPNLRAKLKTMIFLVTWHIWTERNNRIFRNSPRQISDTLAAIRSDMDCWKLAGAKCLQTPLGDPG